MKTVKPILLSLAIIISLNVQLFAQSDSFVEDFIAIQNSLNQGDAKESLRLVYNFVEIYPDSSKAWYFKSQVEKQIIQYKKALESGLNAIDIEPGIPGYYYQIASIYSDLQQQELSISYCDSVINIDSTHLFASILKGNALIKNGQTEEALDQYFILHLQDSMNINFVKRIGSLYTKMDSLENAISWYSRAVEIDTTDIFSFTHLGSLYVRTEQYEVGLPVMSRAIQIDSLNSWLYRFRGSLNIMSANLEEAESDFTNAIHLGDSTAFTFRHLGLSLYKQSKYGKAFPVYETTTKLDPEDSQAWYYLAFCYKWMGDLDNAITCMDKALELSVTPGISDVYNGLAQFYSLEKDYETSMHYYSRAYEWNAEDPVPLAQMGMLVEQTGGEKEYAKTFYVSFIEKAGLKDSHLKNYIESRLQIINEKLFMEGKLQREE